MDPTGDQDDNRTDQSGMSLVHVSTVAYLVMASVGILISLYGHQNFWQLVAEPPSRSDGWQWTAIGLLAAGVLLIGGYLCEGWFASYRAIKTAIVKMLGPTSWYTALYLAGISAVGEEMLFRAAILPFTGLFISSILFGLLHIGPESGLSIWTLWAFFAGLLLGWIVESTGSIYPAIGCHFLVNAFSILRVQWEYRGSLPDVEPES